MAAVTPLRVCVEIVDAADVAMRERQAVVEFLRAMADDLTPPGAVVVKIAANRIERGCHVA